MEIAVLLSGGVDSSLALSLLRRQGGSRLRAYYLKIWLEDELAFLGNCPWEEDMAYVEAVCRKLEIPFDIIPLQREYQQMVVQFAIDELKAGRTPSPDILCNQKVKFGAFLDKLNGGADKIASGHYAQIEAREDGYWLKRAADALKDQTYFLSNLNQHQLEKAIFPIGHLHKQEVRRLAHEHDLPTKNRKDSQGICFLGKLKYRDFVRFHLGERPGAILEKETGKTLGGHQGVWFYTLGQRTGLGLSGGPWYVVGKSVEENVIWVSHKEGHRDQALYEFHLPEICWINGVPSESVFQVKLRHGPTLVEARLIKQEKGYLVRLKEKDPWAAPGQSVIFYRGEYCLGAAMIDTPR